MFIASIGAIVLGEITEGIMVLLLYEIGELLQSIAVDSSRKNIKDLLDLKVDTITKVNGLLQSTVNVEDLNRFEDGTTVNPTVLKEAGLISKNLDGVKILGTGTLTKKLTVSANKFSASAANAIESAGGKVEVI